MWYLLSSELIIQFQLISHPDKQFVFVRITTDGLDLQIQIAKSILGYETWQSFPQITYILDSDFK
jgi:hypothetical protein